MRGLTALLLCSTIALLSLAASCGDSTRAAGATSPTAAGPPAADVPAGERVRFAFAITDRPVTGLIATAFPVGTPLPFDADGALPLPPGEGGVRVVDPVSGLLLFEAADRAAILDARRGRREQVIQLPLPVRVAGAVALQTPAAPAGAGFVGPADRIELHLGSGPRISVADYARREHALLTLPSPDENQAWGMTLPSISSRWTALRPRPDGSFEAGWLALLAAPQLVAADRAGNVATLEVPLPRQLAPHALLTARIAPQPSATVEIDRAGLPTTALPLLLQASLDSAEPAQPAEAALRLALLHRLDARAAAFAMKRGSVDVLLDGPTRIAGLPAFRRLDLRVAGPRPGILLRRALTLDASASAAAQRVARLPLRGAELLGTPRRIPLAGKVRFSDGRPAAGATIVYGSYPDRHEARADRDGRFAIPAVAAGREAVLFVDAPSGGPPPFDRMSASKRLEIPAAEQRVDVELTVPHLPTAFRSGARAGGAATVVSCPGGQAANAIDPIPYRLRTCGDITQSEQLAFCPVLAAYLFNGSTNEVAPVEVSDLQVDPDGAATVARLRVASAGTYTFIVSYTPFVYAMTSMDIQTPDFVTISLQPPDPWPTAIVVAVDSFGRTVPELDIAFSNWVAAVDPFNGLTDKNGAMTVSCFNQDPVDAFVASDFGCFEGALRLQGRGANLVLGSCDGF
jgi:hypothetical protein